MSVLPILHIGDPRLRHPAAEVDPATIMSHDVQRLIDQLIATMRHASGAGLAAPQVGVSKRICVIEVEDNARYPYKPRIPLTVLINPVIRFLTDDRFENNEGCLSVPNLRGNVMRCTDVRVDAFDRFGRHVNRRVSGLSASTFQHECDHLDGLLFVDRLTDPRTLSTWTEFEVHHRAAFVARVYELVARHGE